MPDRELPNANPATAIERPFAAFLSAWGPMLANPRIAKPNEFEGEFIVSTTNGGPAEAPLPIRRPQLMVLAQYIKDLSFENPNAPRSLQQTPQPQIDISVNVTANPITDTDIEVELGWKARPKPTAP